MRFDVTQVTVYDWGAAVPFADCALRLIPQGAFPFSRSTRFQETNLGGNRL